MDPAVAELLRRHADEFAELVGEFRSHPNESATQPLRKSADGCCQGGQQLPPRLSQTLTQLMDGLSEKQVALALGVSQHTVHVYVKTLYRRYGVSSRSELLAIAFRERYEPTPPTEPRA
jgi:DNA-binding NarL/FixJ family response regulator